MAQDVDIPDVEDLKEKPVPGTDKRFKTPDRPPAVKRRSAVEETSQSQRRLEARLDSHDMSDGVIKISTCPIQVP